ncbi:ribonuclease P protein subunit drpp30 [Selaginella moellendorffii]|uniref:ribonuclease P protein subunit drpp30 n=1 Tax=Selaginella moellendorffii TaxID=88036 RepID=UPI000D1C4532|nr:ribonuclease P protein subunit drpp30 [Selaginella moellendorffii]|eukprot:XP_024523064.1 ribonuclease P protein subunit drpp30 [Selaginella moellendorffii]
MFFDLNVCGDGGNEQPRREALAMALQLGYTGVAIPHIVKAVMHESDRCKLRPIKPDVLLAALPGVCESTKFHRRLLGVSNKIPFRQYSRISVVVVDQVQAAALNPSNPVLQSYDVVAVQPMSQQSFAQACTTMEKLSFRIKSSALTDAAIETLVTMTRGRNIILSSGARNACEIRGPNDAANLATLFGLTMEQARAAISKNCK